MDKTNLISQLYLIGAVKFGEFKLKSGMLSPIYIDLRVIVSEPQLLDRIADAMVTLIQDKQIYYDLLAGIPYTALPIATILSVKLKKPMIYTRKEVKDYGTKKKIEGQYVTGQTCLIVDDLITTGDSKFETITPFESEGLKVSDIVVLIDREQGGGQKLADKGYALHSVFTLSEIIDHLVSTGIIDATLEQKIKTFLTEHHG